MTQSFDLKPVTISGPNFVAHNARVVLREGVLRVAELGPNGPVLRADFNFAAIKSFSRRAWDVTVMVDGAPQKFKLRSSGGCGFCGGQTKSPYPSFDIWGLA